MDAFLSAFVLHTAANRGELVHEADVWAASGHPYPTLIRRHVEEDFDVVTGGILISQDSLRASPAPLQRYLVDRSRISFGERFNGRGADYYAGVDVSLSHEARVDTVVTSLYDSIRAVSAISRDEITVEQLPTLLAVLDYTKSQSLTLYHAFTYGERYGDFRLDDEVYQAGVNKLMRAATQAVQRYYQALVGMPWEGELDIPDEAEIRAFFAAEQGNPHLRFKLPELNHPLSILGSAYLNAKREPDTTVIVGAPAGGTELAIVTQLALNHVHKSDPKVVLLPISTHSAKVEGDGLEANLVPQLLERHQDDLQGQNVLITDDSSNTGHTIEVIADIVETAGAARVVARTAQADVHRMSIKQHRWAEPTKRLPHPSTAANAVGVVPITRGVSGMADDRQMVKFRAAKLLRHHHAQQEHGIEVDSPITELEPESAAYAVKICGVHNVVDLERVLAGGTNWIGIHLTYDDPVAYEAKVKGMGSSVATLDNAISQGFYRDRDLPIPWAEFRSIQQTLREIDDKPFDVHTALLMRPRSGAEALRLLNKIVPAGFDKPLYIQLQSAYDPALVADIAEHVHGRYNVQLMQAIGADQEDAADLIAACNTDPHIGMIVLDSQLRGGTGQTSDPDRLTNLAQGIDKPWFLAGGLSADNVGDTLDRLNGVDSTLIGLDLESSVEADEPEVGMHNGAFVKVRKSVDKVGSFVEAVRIHQAQRQYEALDVHGTVFHEALREAWSRTKAETGYFNVRATATYLLEGLKARGLYDAEIDADAINAVVSAAIDYPFTPPATADEVAVAAYESGAGQPWVVAGPEDYMMLKLMQMQ
jgi:phosphoribosylanthranilate isomerase/pyrimidine operon attenuation protein/uracil phosphoribosyltransferase